MDAVMAQLPFNLSSSTPEEAAFAIMAFLVIAHVLCVSILFVTLYVQTPAKHDWVKKD